MHFDRMLADAVLFYCRHVTMPGRLLLAPLTCSAMSSSSQRLAGRPSLHDHPVAPEHLIAQRCHASACVKSGNLLYLTPSHCPMALMAATWQLNQAKLMHLPVKRMLRSCAHCLQANLVCSGVSAGNEAFCTEVTKWGFHERGVLLLTNMSHHLVGEHEQLTWYCVSDDIDFSVNIQELVDGRWQPFK